MTELSPSDNWLELQDLLLPRGLLRQPRAVVARRDASRRRSRNSPRKAPVVGAMIEVFAHGRILSSG